MTLVTTLREIVKFLETVAPPELTVHGRDSYVEIGPQSELEQHKTRVNRVLVVTYPSGRAITQATQKHSNLIVTHWPVLGVGGARLGGSSLIRTRLLVKNYITVYVIGTAYIGARDGIADALVKAIGIDVRHHKDYFTHGGSQGPVPAGRLCDLARPVSHAMLADRTMRGLGLESVQFTGTLDEQVEQVLVLPGSHLTQDDIVRMHSDDIRALITGELTPTARLAAHELKVNTLELGRFVTEEPGMKRLELRMGLEFPELAVEFAESRPPTRALSPG